MQKPRLQNRILFGLLIGATLLGLGCGRNVADVVVSETPPLTASTPTSMSQSPESRKALRWEEQVGGLGFRWAGEDLEILAGKQTLRLFRAVFQNRVRSERRLNDVKGCSLNGYLRPLAAAGDLVSFDNEFSALCGSATDNTWAYSTVEITKDKKGELTFRDVGLSDLFPDADILAAFLRVPQIKESISHLILQQKISQAPQTFDELEHLMAKFPKDFLGGRYYLAESLDSFALRKGEGNELTLWISLMPVAPPEAALRDHLEISLPVPAKYRGAIQAADARTQGFLMHNADSVVGDGSAEFEAEG